MGNNVATKEHRMMWFSAACSENLYHKRKIPGEITSGVYIHTQILRSFLSFSLILLSKKLESSEIQYLVFQVSSRKLLGSSNFNIVLNFLGHEKIEDWSHVVILLLGDGKKEWQKDLSLKRSRGGKKQGPKIRRWRSWLE